MEVVKGFVGRVTPPKDMMGAARKSLSTAGFEELMRRLDGRSPTAAELCAAVDKERANDDRPELNAPQ